MRPGISKQFLVHQKQIRKVFLLQGTFRIKFIVRQSLLQEADVWLHWMQNATSEPKDCTNQSFMHGLITIALRDLPFFAFHGYYNEEKKIGNNFLVNLTVQFQPQGSVTHISDTVNYTSLYSFLEQEMKIPRELLETFLAETVEKLHSKFPML